MITDERIYLLFEHKVGLHKQGLNVKVYGYVWLQLI